jgi:hypothetical protein
MNRFRQRFRAVWGSTQTQDIAEYAVMLAVILLLVIGTVKLISTKSAGRNSSGPTPAGVSQPK